MNRELANHSYEELRGVVVDILSNKERTTYAVSYYDYLVKGVTEILNRREYPGQSFNWISNDIRLHTQDRDLIRDIFWDLFRQGVIILGINDSNEGWPYFRLSNFGERTIRTQNPFRFHDTASFITHARKEFPDISDIAVTYLEEAVAAFYADCLLSSCVMLGGAAEAEFLRLIEVAVASSAKFASAFSSIQNKDRIHEKIKKFNNAIERIKKDLPYEAIEDHETHFQAIQSILRIARNDAGHPKVVKLERENVYIYLQLFLSFSKQLMKLRIALK
jgi:hypothetical protein